MDERTRSILTELLGAQKTSELETIIEQRKAEYEAEQMGELDHKKSDSQRLR